MSKQQKLATAGEDSPISTQSNTPEKPTELSEVLIGEENRRKGLGMIIGFSIAMFYLWLFSDGMRILWPKWLAIMDQHGIQQWHVFTFGIWFWNFFWLAFYNSIMFVIYQLELPFFEKHKINTNPWPWNEDKQEWRKLLKKSISLILLNQLVTTPTLIFLDQLANDWAIRMYFDVEHIPSMPQLFMTLVFFIICEDLAFYIMHKLGHTKLLYRFHKHHHNYINSVSITGQHWHPVDYLMGGLIPVAVGPVLLTNRVHIVAYMAWVVARQGESVDCHCGYEFPWSPYRLLPFSTSAQYHDYHHTHNVGNFSSYFTLWDTIFGDNKDYFAFLHKRQSHNKRSEFNAELKQKLKQEQKREKIE